MKRIRFVLLFIGIVHFKGVFSQSIIPITQNASGGNLTNSSYEFSFAVGDAFTSTIENKSNLISIGVIQPLSIIENCSLSPLTISGPGSFTSSQGSIEYQITSSTPSSIYNWTVTGYTIISGQGTPRIAIQPNTSTPSGIIQVSEINGTCTGLISSLSVTSSLSIYSLSQATVPCDNPNFAISLLASRSVSSGVVGLDLCLTYDSNVLTTTGIATVGGVANLGNPSWTSYAILNQPGTFKISIYYTGLSPLTAQFAGSGQVLSVPFNLKQGVLPNTTTNISICGLTEGSIFGSTTNNSAGTGASTPVSVINSVTYNANLSYAITSNPIPSSGTFINGIDLYCRSTTSTFNPGATGSFTFNTLNGKALRFSRDIPGSYFTSGTVPSVMNAINGLDAFQAASIAVGSITPYTIQALAADVNLDGKVTALDATFISRRSVLQLKEFPQIWNYSGFFPTSTTPSLDWLFIDNTFLSTYTSVTASSVPSVPSCLTIPGNNNISCSAIPVGTYKAILLGDVNGSYTSGNSPGVRESPVGDITYNITNVLQYNSKGTSLIWVGAANVDTTISSLDFQLDIDTTQMEVIQIHLPTRQDISFSWNFYNGKSLLLSSFSLYPYGSLDSLFAIEVKIKNPNGIRNSLQANVGLVNGKTASQRILDNNTVTNYYESDSYSNALIPNPFHDNLELKLSKHITQADISFIDLSGKELWRQNNMISPTGNFRLEPTGLPFGVYLLVVSTPNGKLKFKVIHN